LFEQTKSRLTLSLGAFDIKGAEANRKQRQALDLAAAIAV
jgi:hypothetical protein